MHSLALSRGLLTERVASLVSYNKEQEQCLGQTTNEPARGTTEATAAAAKLGNNYYKLFSSLLT